MRTATLLVLTTLAFAPASAVAQDPALAPGARVRIALEQADTRPMIGRLIAVTRDTLLVRTAAADSIAVPLSEVRRLDVSTGRYRPILKGMGLGFLIGAATGALIGAADGDDDAGFIAFSAGEKAALGAVLFGGLGTVAGGLVGAASPTDRWTQVSPRRTGVRIQVHPRPDAISVAISAAF